MMVRIEVLEQIWSRTIFYLNLEWKILIQNFEFEIKSQMNFMTIILEIWENNLTEILLQYIVIFQQL